jgi:hypothetical protein
MNAQPYTPAQVLANLAECDRQLADFPLSHSGPGWVRDTCRSIAARGIADDRTERLRSALEHALAFIERDHPNLDDPTEKVDSITIHSDAGPQMTCNLKMLRAALKSATPAHSKIKFPSLT